jgi:hypothetical protein
MTERQKRLFFLILFALVFYLVGASFVQSFVSYPAWRLVGVNQFNAYYQELSSRIIRVMVLPGLLEIVLTVPLLWLRPRGIPRWSVALALAFNLVRFVSTAVIQVHIQEQLSRGSLSADGINRMIHGDYLTQASSIARALLYLWMMSRVIDGRERASTGEQVQDI